MSESLLHSLNFPSDLKNLCKDELEQLAGEIREELIEIGNACGGHLASNLGVVELTLALHTVFDSPNDKFLWDTSHQTYVHKILTGRLDKMFTIRQDGGLSGFAKIDESDHDIFGAGHASTALSAALGVAHARNIQQKTYNVISVIGDASLSGGMSFEALNNIGKLKGNFICILNDNDMSISPPVGNMADYITQLRTSDAYTFAKEKFERIFERIPKIGVPLKHKIERTIDRMRDIVLESPVGVIFEEFGFRYLGPIDGHNISLVIAALKYAKNYDGPIMLHMITKKGKGLDAAEADPVKYHGVSPKKKESPKVVVTPIASPTFTQVFGDEIVHIGKKKDDMVVITPAMQGGSGLDNFAKEFPDRFFDVGIAEEHAVTFAAGLARAGIKPVLAIYSTFLQRGYDQVIHDVCLQKLPVVFAIDRAGITGQDGPTHHGVFDYAFLLSIPNIVILAPKDGNELRDMMNWAVDQDIAVSIRYGKVPVPAQNGLISTPISTKKAEILTDYPNENQRYDITIIGVGSMAWPCAEAVNQLAADNINACAINLRFIKPLDTECLEAVISRSDQVLVVEEGVKIGGVFSHILEKINTDKTRSDFHSISIDDHFVDHGKIPTLHHKYNMTTDGIVKTARSILESKKKLLNSNKTPFYA